MRNILDGRSRGNESEEQFEREQNRIDESEAQLTERSQFEEKIENLPDKTRGERSYQDPRQQNINKNHSLRG
ncbi:hypothetical protein [Haloquadratum walsbyi]|uniref:Uncharacterized protein n=1 Tax=Haloquadratum walsbyi J07HQW2 TaxID=1238425 RepID=U1NB06_9EURY|nr:hypothetical protein [Haloquadratum walsbyi]ERG94035.1 MAG: hypothetical protein J07HQW2_00469 [Haloquadratum walsbyi J07HQW2]